MIEVYKIIKNTKVEGPGNRFCIWVQGCQKHCKGCWAKDTWEFGIGKKYSVNQLLNFIKSEKDIDGITFLGGEPFEQAKELSKLANKVKNMGLSVVCFTGYTIEELKDKNDISVNDFLQSIDLLIDGGFEADKFDLSRPWVGSSNQRYHFLTDRFSRDIVNRYKNKIEARINPDGKLEINGMGDFEKIKKEFCLQLGKNKI
ncbi:radical SAM protein [bacterium]|nr:radical SAM protein [bacterium]MBQ9246936.1 radical SAM protein [bacterium]